MKHINEKPKPPREINSKIPVGLEQIILCAMSKDPKDRFKSAEEMLTYMRGLKDNPEIKFKELNSVSGFKTFIERIKSLFTKKGKK
jgi:serine/threonine-protein kinase